MQTLKVGFYSWLRQKFCIVKIGCNPLIQSVLIEAEQVFSITVKYLTVKSLTVKYYSDTLNRLTLPFMKCIRYHGKPLIIWSVIHMHRELHTKLQCLSVSIIWTQIVAISRNSRNVITFEAKKILTIQNYW